MSCDSSERPSRRGAVASGPANGVQPASPFWLAGFRLVSAWKLRRVFSDLHVGYEPGGHDRIRAWAGPVVVYANHPSWWDPLVFLMLHLRLFGDRPAYAPIDARALSVYRVFRKLGFFGVGSGRLLAARQFLEGSRQVLSRPDAVLWVTPQGRFSDVRQRPVALEAGVAALAGFAADALYLPVAVEYVFDGEPKPFVSLQVGTGLVRGEEPAIDREGWRQRLACALETQQDALAARVRVGAGREGEPLLGGGPALSALFRPTRGGFPFLKGAVAREGHAAALDAVGPRRTR